MRVGYHGCYGMLKASRCCGLIKFAVYDFVDDAVSYLMAKKKKIKIFNIHKNLRKIENNGNRIFKVWKFAKKKQNFWNL